MTMNTSQPRVFAQLAISIGSWDHGIRAGSTHFIPILKCTHSACVWRHCCDPIFSKRYAHERICMLKMDSTFLQNIIKFQCSAQCLSPTQDMITMHASFSIWHREEVMAWKILINAAIGKENYDHDGGKRTEAEKVAQAWNSRKLTHAHTHTKGWTEHIKLGRRI